MKLCLGLIFLIAVLAGCTSAPTKIYRHRKEPITGKMEEGLLKPLVIDAETIVIDARSEFEFGLAHLPKAFRISADEFYDGAAKYKGQLDKNLFRLARRLARKGVSPKSKVIVVGDKQSFAAGQVAWGLYYLGVSDIQFASMSYFKERYSNVEAKPYKAAKMWKPKYQRSVLVKESEVQDYISRGIGSKNSKGERVFLLDVRLKKEFLDLRKIKRGFRKVNIDAYHIPYKSFFTSEGRPNLKMKKRLRSIGMTSRDRLIVVSNQGQRSAGVTVALLALGFKNSGNFSEGFQKLLD